MRILNELTDKSLENITLYLTMSEALKLRDGLNDLLKKPMNNHIHVSNEDFQKEVTICIYDINNLNGFDQRSVDLIKDDR